MSDRTKRTAHTGQRLAALLAGFAALVATGTPALAAGAARPGLLTAAPEYPASVTINTVSPSVADQSTGTVTVTGTVTNSGGSAFKSAHAAVRKPSPDGRKSLPLQTRSDLNLVAIRNSPGSADGIDLAAPLDQLGDLAPGQSKSFKLEVPTAKLDLGEAGAYELAVDVWEGNEAAENSHPLGIARTFLPYNTPASPLATNVAALWPITHSPELVAQTMQDAEQTPVLRDDSLTKDLAPGGRLYELVNTGAGLPGLTWMVDPDLLDAVYAMTRNYRVQKPGTQAETATNDNTVPGGGKAVATAWLAALRTAVATAGSQVVALPYADPDLASIAHNGVGLPGMDTALRKAGTVGRLTAEGRLATDVTAGVAWPYDGYLDQAVGQVAQTAGDGVVLVNGMSLPDPASLRYTPNAVRKLGNGLTAVVADPVVSEPFQHDLSTPKDVTAATQRFLAETMTITQQQPQDQRSLLVMPPRELTAATAKALANALTQAQNGKWLQLVKLDTVAQAQPNPQAATNPADYPAGVRASELDGTELGSVMSMQGDLDQLLRILTQPQRVRSPFSAAMLRSMSTAWRADPAAGDDYRAGVKKYLYNLITAVKVPKKSVITLPGDSGTLLVSVKNDLTQAVGNLELRLTSVQPNRLNVGPPETVVLDASTSRTLRFPAEAKVNGTVQMTAQLYTTGPGGGPYGEAVTFNVDVTSVTQGVLYVIGGGVVLMLLAGGRFYLQRKKRAGEPEEDPDAPLEPGPDAAYGASADATDPAAGDEKVGH
ncbi:hypothetical protein CFP65_3762 [Kitasatospora sp. MMS16-BH015]|uniref:DUF6049 family protein n=1 Tax=Kitasatospora sp. MMS16-BH015 TaxID=2018025 RepID=UPI000CA3BBF6|nr:DUF6049 family protein [Kitasatospora sp. MMS16-BH015]AUG78547.1 hypothetical protein CFP65_3762 [Kitasatospora sp. MMS16-BH015]